MESHVRRKFSDIICRHIRSKNVSNRVACDAFQMSTHIFKPAVAERCSSQLFKDEAVLSFKIVYGRG